VQDAGSISCAAIVAVLSLLFRRPVPAHLAVVAEVQLDGGLHSPDLTDGTFLSLAKANKVSYLITTESAAQRLREWKQRHARRAGQVKLLGCRHMKDVMQHFFDDDDDEEDEEEGEEEEEEE
jgi:predicted ATP-dependent serine protease